MNTQAAKKGTINIQTQLGQKTEELRESEERYHHMIAEIKDYAIFSIDTQGNIQTWNLGAEKIKGYKEEEIVGKNFRIFYTPEELAMKIPEKLLDQAYKTGSASHEGWRVRKDGSRFWGSVTITAFHDEHNKVIGFTKVTRDLTERKKAEDALNALSAELAIKNKELEEKNQILERANADLSSFNYIASHDLQEPLRKIQVIISKIIEDAGEKLNEDLKKNFERVQKATLQMQKLIMDLLTYSRSITHKKAFENIDLNTIIEEVQNELSLSVEEHRAQIHSDKLPIIHAIPFQMRQLFLNLFSNALKFSTPGKALMINVKSKIISGNTLQGIEGKEKKYYDISVSDNGIGFDPKYKDQIFELFQRLHTRDEFPGTGLGLTICKKIAENHGGFMTADSEEGKGAVFHIYLPV
jgi:PAS domain S-box-containing protein